MSAFQEKAPFLPVNIVVAHALEAKPLIRMLGLQPLGRTSTFPVYENSDGLRLIVSGIGKAAAANAVRYIAEKHCDDDAGVRAWLNVGICGHRTASPGSAYLVNKITEQSSGKNAYPPQLIGGIATAQLVTVDEPETAYPMDAVYEMEASAFFDEACRWTTGEFVQVFKVVSDNLENPISELDLKQVPNWIMEHEEVLSSLIEELAGNANRYNDIHSIPRAYQLLSGNLHFTVNQKIQLKRLCQRYRALGREEELEERNVLEMSNSKALLAHLMGQLEHSGKRGSM